MNITANVTAALQYSWKTICVALKFVYDDDDDDDDDDVQLVFNLPHWMMN